MPRIIDFIHDQRTHLSIPAPPADTTEATYIVTGANTGLGLECSKHLFLMGTGSIILAVRCLPQGEAALATLRSETGRPDAGEVWELDLASLSSVEAFCKHVRKLERLYALIANAGVVMAKLQLVEGVRQTLFVNVVATMPRVA